MKSIDLLQAIKDDNLVQMRHAINHCKDKKTIHDAMHFSVKLNKANVVNLLFHHFGGTNVINKDWNLIYTAVRHKSSEAMEYLAPHVDFTQKHHQRILDQCFSQGAWDCASIIHQHIPNKDDQFYLNLWKRMVAYRRNNASIEYLASISSSIKHTEQLVPILLQATLYHTCADVETILSLCSPKHLLNVSAKDIESIDDTEAGIYIKSVIRSLQDNELLSSVINDNVNASNKRKM